MKDRILSIIRQKGYNPIFMSIRNTLNDFKEDGLNHYEAKKALLDFYDIGDVRINEFIKGL